MDRDILHLSIPAFPIALARIEDSSLRERPVAIASVHSERALLQCVSKEAQSDGVHEGMAVYQARRFCPSLILLPPNPQRVSRGTQAIEDISAQYSPVLEPNAAGRLFLDLTGSRRLLGSGIDVAAKLDKEIASRLRLQGAVGLAGNKLVSRIAAGYLTEPGVCDILRGSEGSFIGPLPISVLPGIGKSRTLQLLQDLNLRKVKEAAELSVAQLRLALGPFAPLLHQRARGIDPSPVRPPQRSTDICEDAFLDQEDNDDEMLLAALGRLVEGCGLRLRQLGKSAGKLALTISYVDGMTEQRSSTFATPQNHDLLLYAAAEDLFHRACGRRVRVKAMKLVCSRFEIENRQMGLFADISTVSGQQQALQEALDYLRTKYGMTKVQWGRSMDAV